MNRIAVALMIAAMVGCGSSTPLAPTPEPSPSPSPAELMRVLVKAEVRQGGNVTTGVQARTDFKVSGTPTACFQGGLQVDCGIIPFWDQSVTGGQGTRCSKYGSQSSNTLTWNCAEPGDVTIKVCAQDFDGRELGCDQVSLFIG